MSNSKCGRQSTREASPFCYLLPTVYWFPAFTDRTHAKERHLRAARDCS